ncbi:MAG: hypothetical protein C5B60_07745 [Chloroflexi bacterium]|nr:MAG: hypothetical protein C5B60_07745 [Chloroflexota bacterium]
MAKRRLALYLGASVVSILLGSVLAEGLTRLALPFSTVEYRVDPNVGQILVANQRTRWMHQDYDEVVETNSAGFHDVEHQITKPADVYRIVVLGDSFIEALSAPIELGFTQQLEELLHREVKTQHIEVINLGVGGMGPAQHLRMLEAKGMTYQPDLVIMSVFPDNDFWDSSEQLSWSPSKVFYRLQPNGSLKYMPADNSWVTAKLRPGLRKSAFLTTLRAGMNATNIETWLGRMGLLAAPGVAVEKTMRWSEWGVYLADHPEPWPDAYRTTLECIKSASELSTSAGARFLVMLIGSVATVEDRWDEALSAYSEANTLRWDFEHPFSEITELGQRTRNDVINLVPLFREDFRATKISRSWSHDGHWNPSGNRLAAEILTRHLLANRSQYSLAD